MKHGTHLYLMGGLAVLAVVLLFTGIPGGGWMLFLWVGACAVMMLFMMRGMNGGGGQHGGQPAGGGRGESAEQPSTPAGHDRHA